MNERTNNMNEWTDLCTPNQKMGRKKSWDFSKAKKKKNQMHVQTFSKVKKKKSTMIETRHTLSRFHIATMRDVHRDGHKNKTHRQTWGKNQHNINSTNPFLNLKWVFKQKKHNDWNNFQLYLVQVPHLDDWIDSLLIFLLKKNQSITKKIQLNKFFL
jgi:hypothetical protein